MKAEEREELKQNDLEGWLQVGLPLFLRKNGSYLLLALALLLLGYQLWNWHQRKQAEEIQVAWSELDAASAPNAQNAPDKLQAIINQYDVKPVQALAWLQVANVYLQDVAEGNPAEGYNGLKVSKDEALLKAEQAAKRVIAEYPDQTLAVGKAHLALAVVALDRGDWDAAKKEYEFLSDKKGPFADTAFAFEASVQLAHLEDYRQAPRLADMVIAAPATQADMKMPMMGLPTAGPATMPR
jgi:predicted negative regulator of RcsB-dependent stress response